MMEDSSADLLHARVYQRLMRVALGMSRTAAILASLPQRSRPFSKLSDYSFNIRPKLRLKLQDLVP